MASVKQKVKKDGTVSYEITVSLGRDYEGKKVIKTTTFIPKSKNSDRALKEAEAYAAVYEKQVRDGDIPSGKSITFTQFVKIWEENWLPAKTPTVRENYSDVLRVRVLPEIGGMRLTAIKALHIDKILNAEKAEGKAPKTVRMTFTVINSVLRYAVKKQYITENPCLRCDDLPPITMKTGNDLSFFTPDQTNRFLKEALTREYEVHIKGHQRTLKKTGEKYDVPGYVEKRNIPYQWRVYFTMAIEGQLRRGEMCALTWRDVDFKNHIVSVTKAIANTKSGQIVKEPKTKAGIRDIVLPPDCMALLKQWKKDQRTLCSTLGTAWKGHRDKIKDGKAVDSFEDNTIFIQIDNGRQIHLSTPGHKFGEIIDLYNAACEKEAEQAKTKAERKMILDKRLPKIRLHDLRHTGATVLLSRNVPVETVARRLGHSKASVTWDIYGHALPEDDKKASEVLGDMFG